MLPHVLGTPRKAGRAVLWAARLVTGAAVTKVGFFQTEGGRFFSFQLLGYFDATSLADHRDLNLSRILEFLLDL
jgi:hypothetical protein